jgi:arylsulfatase
MEARSYRTTYDKGWDQIREERYARQIKMGLIKPEWPLSPRAFNPTLNDGASAVGPWADAPDKAWQARRMAVYAGMVQRMDQAIAAILEKLHASGAEKNTLVIFLSDNGGCQENVKPNWYDIPSKTRSGQKIHVGNDPTVMAGPETSYQSYGPAWANASNTPFRKFKHFTEEGGISTPFIARWPAGNLQAGRIERDAVGDVIDLMPTIAAVSGAHYPNSAPPLEGQSLLPVLKGSATATSRTLFWEHEGNRAVRIGDWKLVAPRGEAWKLFNVVEDRTELNDRSAEMKEKVAGLKSAYDAWAKRVGVEPWPIQKSK